MPRKQHAASIAIQPNIPTSKASDSVSAITASKIASSRGMFLIDLIGWEGYSDRVRKDKLRQVFGKMNASEQRQSKTKNEQRTQNVADDATASAMGRRYQ